MTSILREPPPRGAVILAMMLPSGVRFCEAGADEMASDRAADVPPPGAGFNTVTCAVPAVATSAAAMDAVRRVALTKLVLRLAPFQRTVEPAMKFEPSTVRVKPALPAVALAGAIEDSSGNGLLASGAVALIANVSTVELPPPGAGLKTDTWAGPAAAMSPAVMAAVNCVLLTKLVGRSAPFQRTVDALEKLPPLTVRENAAPPAAALVGASDDKVGTALVNWRPN